jgi:hypothetical protein
MATENQACRGYKKFMKSSLPPVDQLHFSGGVGTAHWTGFTILFAGLHLAVLSPSGIKYVS